MKNKEERGVLSQSFVMGIIALVFLIIGYQTALFVHHSAVTKIVANRDHPDTVYICQPSLTEEVRYAPASHSKRVETVRQNVPRPKVESFRFNPNEASADELCRLGFSPKQAQAILNYRAKGGRFRRKSDFAASFVVSDSIYARLEPYIDIPLTDLNTADSAAFDALPGIGGWYASKMLEYRRALGSYSFKEQLMDIRNFDRERFDALADLITLDQEHIKPYPLWTLPADSLRRHPYIGDYAAKGIVLYREHNPVSQWTVDALIEASLIHPDKVDAFRRIRIEAPQ